MTIISFAVLFYKRRTNTRRVIMGIWFDSLFAISPSAIIQLDMLGAVVQFPNLDTLPGTPRDEGTLRIESPDHQSSLLPLRFRGGRVILGKPNPIKSVVLATIYNFGSHNSASEPFLKNYTFYQTSSLGRLELWHHSTRGVWQNFHILSSFVLLYLVED